MIEASELIRLIKYVRVLISYHSDCNKGDLSFILSLVLLAYHSWYQQYGNTFKCW